MHKPIKRVAELMLVGGVALSASAELTAIDANTMLPDSVILDNSSSSTGSSKVDSAKAKGQKLSFTKFTTVSSVILKLSAVTTVGDLSLEIHAADENGFPVGEAIYSASTNLPAEIAAGDFLQLDFPAIDFTPGQYTFTVSTTSSDFSITTNESLMDLNLIRDTGSGWSDTGNGTLDLNFALVGTEQDLLISLASELPADLIVDNYGSSGNGQTVVSTDNSKGQTFTMTQDGKISAFIVEANDINAASDINLSIFATEAGLPTGAALYSKDGKLPAGITNGSMLQFSFPELPLTAGSYAVVLTGPGADLKLKTLNAYSGGNIIRNNAATNLNWAPTGNGASDMSFAIAGSLNTTRPIAAGPNIIHILIDDMSYTDNSVDSLVRFQNELSDLIETPNLETLASQGVSFTWSYTQPNCAPSRAAFMSGQYSPRTGNGVYNVDSLNRGSGTKYLTVQEQGQNDGDGINSGDDFISGEAHSVPLAQALYNLGYSTAHIGKYHVGARDSSNITHPLNQGFQFNYGGNEKGNPGSFFASGSPRTWPSSVGPELDAYAADYTQEYIDNNLVPFANGNDPQTLLGTKKHLTDGIVDALEDFVNNHRSGSESAHPFFVQMHMYATHGPIQPRPDLKAKYDARKALINPTNDTKAGFAALAENMDQSIGRIMRYINDPNLDGDTSDSIADNTLIIWTTDNGGSESETENAPLRGRKGMHLEGGVRVPMIISMPGTIPADKISESLVHSVDMYPTILDFAMGEANTPNPNEATHKLDGTSLYSHLLDPESVERVREGIFYHFPGYMDTRAYACSMVIKEVDGVRYKYIYNYDPYYTPNLTDYNGQRPDEFQLYDLTNDPYETVNLMDYIDVERADDPNDPSTPEEYQNYLDYKDVANQLAAELNAWLIGEEGDTSWTPLYAKYKQNFADASPTIDDSQVGQETGPAPASVPDLPAPTE